MTSLLRIRLDVLDNDIDKVAGAVDQANQRGREINDVIKALGDGERSVIRMILQLEKVITDISNALNLNDDIGESLDEAEGPKLRKDVADATADFDELNTKVMNARNDLQRIRTTIVAANDRFTDQSSLQLECNELHRLVKVLRTDLDSGDLDAQAQRRLWTEYEDLLITRGRPLFGEYVDFLGGLTMRDTGLDDRVCEMTDVLLAGFTTVTGYYLPIPSRTAALSSALDSVVKLGFPEWSMWGVPLVAHEVGLALTRNPKAVDVTTLLEATDRKWSGKANRARLAELFADVFGAYTIGPAYGYAALMLRLHPHHDEQPGDDEARDVDRARLILDALSADSDPGTTFSTEVGRLRDTWEEAVVTLAGTERASEARAEVIGPSREEDWLDDYVQAVRVLLTKRGALQPFDEVRWARAATTWADLSAGTRKMNENTDDVLAVLNQAWAARVKRPDDVHDIAAKVEALWGERKRASRRGRAR
jgi:hypothetical protein